MQVRCHVSIDGNDMYEDVAILEGGVHCVVGTPGHVLDLLLRKYLTAKNVHMLILDEADELLSLESRPVIHGIFQQLPSKLQVIYLPIKSVLVITICQIGF